MAKKFLAVLVIITAIAVLNFKVIIKNVYPVRYQNEVVKYSAQYDLDQNLVYSLIKVESKFNPYAKSQKGAVGLMQITSGTGKYISSLLKEKSYSDERLYDAETNIKYGCYYMSKLLKDFNGNIDCMLAAYNGGEGNARKWITTDEDGNMVLDTKQIPFSETKNYIERVNKNYKIYKWLYDK